MFDPFSPFVAVTEGLVAEAIRTNVRGILDSYHSDFDFLVEAIQNAAKKYFDMNNFVQVSLYPEDFEL